MNYRDCTIEEHDVKGYRWWHETIYKAHWCKTHKECEGQIDDYWHDEEINDMNQLENLKEWVEEAKKVLDEFEYDDPELAARSAAYDHVLTMITKLED